MNFCKLGLSVIEIEARAIQDLSQRIDEHFEQACELMLACKGRIIVTGMGKSGHIGSKIAATLASTGSPAFFVHPGEASHGDLGMITRDDTVLAISNSGTTKEIMVLLPLLKRLQVPLITLCGKTNSPLAQQADVNLDISVEQEACPLGLAPTTSTTATLVMGDALAVALLEARGFSSEDFALSHPGGTLGKRLLLRIDDIWHTGEHVPIVHENERVADALIEVTNKKLGMTCVVDDAGRLVGVYTDGDVRRTLTNAFDINSTIIKSVMTENCQTVNPGTLAAQALTQMEQLGISALIVVEDRKPIAIVHIHDLLKSGVI